MTDPLRRFDTGEAVDHLSDYYQHLATLSAGAIVVVGALAGNFKPDSGTSSATTLSAATVCAVIALICLGACILLSTGMMWSYGVARRETAKALAAVEGRDAWAFDVSSTSLARARTFVKVGSTWTPLAFVGGFVFLAGYAALLFI